MTEWKKINGGYTSNGKCGLWDVREFGIGWAVYLNNSLVMIYETKSSAFMHVELHEF